MTVFYAVTLGLMGIVTGAWRRAAAGAGLLSEAGVVAPTIFAEMSALAARTGAVNLGQGFPDQNPPDEVVDAARDAILRGENQYAPGRGTADLLAAVSEHQNRFYGLTVDPETEVIITAGATEALASVILALINGPDDEVVVCEPYYDSYAAIVALSGARLRTVPLRAPDFQPDLDVLADVVSDRTRIILVNDPHNPTGAVMTAAAQAEVVRLAEKHGALIVTDEVYEHLSFRGDHVPIASLPGAAERTLTISSAGKTFSATGWKIGWVHGPADLITAVLSVKQFLTYTNGTPFQPAVAVGLRLPDSFFTEINNEMRDKHRMLAEGLTAAGFTVYSPAGGYFTVADASALGGHDADAFCRALPERVGVAAIPLTAFVSAERRADYAGLVRFAACKHPDVLAEAMARLATVQAD